MKLTEAELLRLTGRPTLTRLLLLVLAGATMGRAIVWALTRWGGGS